MKEIIIGMIIAFFVVSFIESKHKHDQIIKQAKTSDSLRLELNKSFLECEKNYEKLQLKIAYTLAEN